MKYILILLISIPTITNAFDMVNYDSRSRHWKNDRSHWQVTLGAKNFEYDPSVAYSADNREVSGESEENFGGALGFGWELKLFSRLSTSTRLEGFYTARSSESPVGTIGSSSGGSNLRQVSRVSGAMAYQSLNYQFPGNKWIFQVFVEGGIGRGKANSDINYNYETSSEREFYNANISDDLSIASFGGGLNIINSSGFFSFIRVESMNITTDDRVVEGNFLTTTTISTITDSSDTEFSTTDSSVADYTVTSLTIGGGYKF